MSFSAVIEPFLEMLMSERGASQSTIEAYGQDFRKFQKFLGKKPFLEVNHEDIQEYLAFLLNSGLKARSAARHLSSVRQLYEFLMEERRIQADPTLHIHAPEIYRALPKVLSHEDVKLLIETARRDLRATGVRLWAMVELFYATGMRVSELLDLKVQQFTTCHESASGEKLFYITGKGDKERVIPLTDSARQAIEAYLEVRSSLLKGIDPSNPFLFPSSGKKGRLTRQRVFQLLRSLALKAGVALEKISPHTLRHAFATHLLRGGADLVSLQQLLGHQDLTSTQIYTHVAQDHLVEIVMNNHPLSANRKP